MAMAFTAAIAKYFGRKDGQSMGEFAEEIRALTPKDKEELRGMLSVALNTPVDEFKAPSIAA
jgi:hypothetical protein